MATLTCANQLSNELLLCANVDSQLPDFLLGLGQPPLRGHGNRDLAGMNPNLTPTNSCKRQDIQIRWHHPD